MGLCDTNTRVYQFTFDKEKSDNTHIIHYCVMNVIGSRIKLNSYVAHMLYAWLFSHNASVTIDIKQNKNYISLVTHTTVFYSCYGNSNKTEHILYNNY